MGRYTVALMRREPGLYQVRLNAAAGGKPLGESVAHLRRVDGVLEQFGSWQHRPMLERIARETGGRYWTLDDLDELPEAIRYSHAGMVESHTIDLWNAPLGFPAAGVVQGQRVAAAPALEAPVIRPVLAVLAIAASMPAAGAATQVLVLSGLGGEPQYEQRFEKWSEQVSKASATATGDPSLVQRLAGRDAQRGKIEAALRAARRKPVPVIASCWCCSGMAASTATTIASIFPVKTSPAPNCARCSTAFPEGVSQLVVNATSTSGAIVDSWAGPRRLVIAATKSGGERNATRFGGYWARPWAAATPTPTRTAMSSAQEAYDYANRKVTESFKTDASVATEHARLAGPDAARFVVARLGAAALFASDAQLAAMRGEQDGIEQRIDQVRAQKAQLSEDDYYARLEPVLLEMARLGRRIDARLAQLGVANGGGNGRP